MMGGRPRYLVTTADERTWESSEPVLWLGEWCRIYTRRHLWEAMDGKLLEYHWDDRERLERDYFYLNALYEKTLASLAAKLNDIHGTSYGLRYWRILTGPWLAYFAHILYDRWLSIQSAVAQYEIAGTLTLPRTRENFAAPNDMADFLHLTREDEWNSHVYAEIVRRFTSIPIVERFAAENTIPHGNLDATSDAGAGRLGLKRRIGRSMRTLALHMATAVGRDTDVFINTPYLTKRTLARLFLKLRQFPVMWDAVPAPRVGLDMRQRAWSLKQTGTSDFESFFLDMIPVHVPRFCVEGYKQLTTYVRNLPWPSKPRLLYTANVLWHDTVSMGYFADKVERGAPLLYGQHGGVYGTAKFQFAREHESKVADDYLVWGSAGVGCLHEHNVGITKLDKPQSGPFGGNRRLLLVTLNTPRYPYRLCSESARNFLADLNDSFSMIEALQDDIRVESLVRLIPVELGWHLPERWKNRFPDISLDPGYVDIHKLMRTSRLVAFNYNQTGFLEALAMGIPTVLLCDFRKYPLTADAVPFYESLKDVGICHETPQSAADHIVRVWDNVDMWWSEVRVQEALGAFRRRYCDLRADLSDRVFDRIRLMEAV